MKRFRPVSAAATTGTSVRSVSVAERALKRSAIWLAIIAVFTALGFSMANDEEVPTPYDPESNSANGTRALSLLMEHYGATVEVSARPEGTAIIFNDDLSESELQRLASWVELGGTLVVADPFSSIANFEFGNFGLDVPPEAIAPNCDSNFVDGVGLIQPNKGSEYLVFDDNSGLFECFSTDAGPFMLEESYGNGRVVYLATAEIFTNKMLAQADNSVLAYNLLQPADGVTVTFLTNEASLTGEGIESGENSTLIELIPGGVWAMIVELILAGLLLMLWRGRRIAKPVDEPQQVEIAASELTGAVGNLMQNAGQIEGAATVLRNDLKVNAAQLMGLPKNVETELLISTINERTGIASQRLFDVLANRPVDNSRELVALARMIEDVYQEIANVR